MKNDLIIVRIIALSYILLTTSVYAQNPKGGWDFTYSRDSFTNDAMLDLRYLNESYAGENGFVGLSSDSNSFVTENGAPMRFWAINGGSLSQKLSDEEYAEYARFLSKMGVNMIRFHGSINPKNPYATINDVDKTEVNAIWKMVAAMKKEGIYSTISPFWAHNGHMGGNVPSKWGIDGYSGTDDLWAVMFFSDTLKQAYKSWVRYLYTETNPYTGIALKDEPAVGLIQVKNEDGLFFWTIQNIKPELKSIIKKKYYQWLEQKYGSIDKAQSAWGNVTLDEDDPSKGEMDIYIIWYATEDWSGALDKRLTDQIEFMANIQRDFYTEMYDFYRSLGCKQLINGNNWKTASASKLLDTERWTNTACDVIALNRYYDPVHVGTNCGWRIDPGHYYEGKSVLFQPNKLPINVKQPDGHPVVVTESGWNLPHKYQAEGPFLIAAYMSLTGVDGFYWFSPSSSSYDSNPYRYWTTLEGDQHPLSRWTISTPGQIGLFPANALLYRRGYLSPGDLTVFEERTLEALWKREIPALTEEMGFDPNRDTHDLEVEDTEISPMAFLTGRVAVKYGTLANRSTKSTELNELMDFQGKTVTSSTKQLAWDYQQGVCLMDAPSAQGICGFTGKQEIFGLSEVTIETTNEYVTVNVVSMDEKSISESTKLLVQVGTVYRPENWSETPTDFENNGEPISGFAIENTGNMPWKCANTLVKLTIKNANINQATLLNEAGYAAASLNVSKSEETVCLELPENAMYVVLENSPRLAVDEVQNNSQMKVYPIPNNGNFNIEIGKSVISDYSVEIYDVLGQKIWEQIKLTQRELAVNIKSASGMVFVHLKKDGETIDRDKIFINQF